MGRCSAASPSATRGPRALCPRPACLVPAARPGARVPVRCPPAHARFPSPPRASAPCARFASPPRRPAAPRALCPLRQPAPAPASMRPTFQHFGRFAADEREDFARKVEKAAISGQQGYVLRKPFVIGLPARPICPVAGVPDCGASWSSGLGQSQAPHPERRSGASRSSRRSAAR